jgi:hypothetical protein
MATPTFRLVASRGQNPNGSFGVAYEFENAFFLTQWDLARPTNFVKAALRWETILEDTCMEKETIVDVIYGSGTHPTEKTWDVMQVVFQHKNATTGAKRTGDSFTIARKPDGTILRRVDIFLDHWEIITNEEDLQFFQSHFDTRDRLAIEQAAEAAKKAKA